MALEVINLTRAFTYRKDAKEIELVDPNSEMSPAEVLKFYSGTYPELTNGVVEGPTIVKDQARYVVTTKAGKLG